jgi:hypothetical protein
MAKQTKQSGKIVLNKKSKGKAKKKPNKHDTSKIYRGQGR